MKIVIKNESEKQANCIFIGLAAGVSTLFAVRDFFLQTSYHAKKYISLFRQKILTIIFLQFRQTGAPMNPARCFSNSTN